MKYIYMDMVLGILCCFCLSTIVSSVFISLYDFYKQKRENKEKKE